MPTAIQRVIDAAKKLSRDVDRLSFADPVTHVYNPLNYAWAAHQQYIELANPQTCRVLMLGMNPGPWGMAQTGVPFGQIDAVKNWMNIDAKIGRPANEHEKRPIQGLDCPKSEVSGQRLWGLFREVYPQPERFFAEHFIANYCPLVFMEASARNRTPDKLPVGERQLLDEVCDEHLLKLLEILRPQYAIGVGAYAEKCLKRVAKSMSQPPSQITRILHPSPASPAANRGWAPQALQQLRDTGAWSAEAS
ncbi:MAG: uracil-DNA glycosylase family protein [Planctomycetota bacterium]